MTVAVQRFVFSNNLFFVRRLRGDFGGHDHIGAAVVVPPFHAGVEHGAGGRFGTGDLQQDLVGLVVVLLGEITGRLGQDPRYVVVGVKRINRGELPS